MIRSITVESLSNGQSLKLILASPEMSQGFAVINCNGLGPGQAKVNDSDWVTIDGSSINSARLPARDINIDLRFVPTAYDESVADIRRKSYVYFPIKKMVRLTFEFQDFKARSTIRRRWIEGIVAKNETGPWSEEEGCSIQIRCGDPYFRDVEIEEDSFSLITPLFHFEFPDEVSDHPWPVSSVEELSEKIAINTSTINVGAVFTLEATAAVKNPYIFNRTTSQGFGLDYTLNPGEVLIIDTRRGHKRVYVKDGRDTSKLGYLAVNSKWIEFVPGENTIGYLCDSNPESLHVSYTIEPVYEGI